MNSGELHDQLSSGLKRGYKGKKIKLCIYIFYSVFQKN